PGVGVGGARPGRVVVAGLPPRHAAAVAAGPDPRRTTRAGLGHGRVPRSAVARRPAADDALRRDPSPGVRVQPLAARRRRRRPADAVRRRLPGRLLDRHARGEAAMSARRLLLWLFGWSVVLAVLAPLAFAAWVSFSPDSFLTPPTGAWSLRWYEAFAADRRWTAALIRSVIVGLASALVALVTGTPLAYAVARHRFRGRTLLSGTALLPACVPPAVLGMGLLPLLFAVGLWGSLTGLI